MPLEDPDKFLEKELSPELFTRYKEGLLGRKRKGFCDDCIALCKKRAGGKFYPKCTREASELVDMLSEGLDAESKKLLAGTLDPVEWAHQEFNWNARYYQSQVLRCSSQKIALRQGRRTGKTAALAVKSLYLAATKPGVKDYEPYVVMIVTPYEAQLDKFFEYMRDLLARAVSFKPVRDNQNPQSLWFSNNSKICGFTAGFKTGARSDKIRGQDSHFLVIDEAEFLRNEDIDSIMAILSSHEECGLIFSSTPTGMPTKFRKACENPKWGFKEFWFASHEAPTYSKDTDDFFHNSMDRIQYEHEILAEFGTASGGVFLPDYLQSCIVPSCDTELMEDELAIIGVDCNDQSTGTHAVVVGARIVDKVTHFRVLEKKILKGMEFSHERSKEMLIDLFLRWNASLISLDKGFATAQIESLLEHAIQHPESNLANALKYYDLGSHYKYTDPLSGQEVSRPHKPLMVGISQRVVREGRIEIPASEDTEIGIIGQMRRFKVEKVSRNNQPIYSQGNEHDLTAMMLAIMAWVLEVTGFDPVVTGDKLVARSDTKVPDDLPLPVPSSARGMRSIPQRSYSLDDEPTKRPRRIEGPWEFDRIRRPPTRIPTRRKMF